MPTMLPQPTATPALPVQRVEAITVVPRRNDLAVRARFSLPGSWFFFDPDQYVENTVVLVTRREPV
jgi:hypothetical protein